MPLPKLIRTSSMLLAVLFASQMAHSAFPQWNWSSFLGGSSSDRILAIDLDESDRIVAVGQTSSSGFPFPSPSPGGIDDAFVALIDPSQNGAAQIVWSKFLGGSGQDIAFDVEYCATQCKITVVGLTDSPDFPTTPGAYQTVHSGGRDAFVTQLDLSGNLLYSTYLGTADDDRVAAVEVDASSGLISVLGATNSRSFPTSPGAFQANLAGAFDLVVARLDPARSAAAQLVVSTYLGGSNQETPWYRTSYVANWDAMDLHVSAAGEVTIASNTNSTNFPTTPNACRRSYRGSGGDIVLARLNASLGQLLYSTYFGSSADDNAVRIAVDGSGVVTLAGVSRGTNVPTTPGAYQPSFRGGSDGILIRLDPSRTPVNQLVYSTYLGGPGYDGLMGLAVEEAGIIVACGGTDRASALQGTNGAWQPSYPSGMNAAGFALRLDPAGNGTSDLHFFSYVDQGSRQLGWWQTCTALARRSDGYVALAGATDNPAFPTTGGQRSYGGGPFDGWLLTMDLLPGRTLPLGSHRPACRLPIYMQVNSNPYPGNPCFEIQCHRVPASALGSLILGIPTPGGISLPGFGITLFTTPDWFFPGLSDSVGFARSACIPIPQYFPAPAGIALQWFWLDPGGCGSGFATSNALQIR